MSVLKKKKIGKKTSLNYWNMKLITITEISCKKNLYKTRPSHVST